MCTITILAWPPRPWPRSETLTPPPPSSRPHVEIARFFFRFEDIGHSSDARKTLEEYVVGEIEGYVAPEPGAAGSSEGGSSMMMIAILLVLLAVGAAVMMQ